MADPQDVEQAHAPKGEVTIFVSDASAEADRLSGALRARGYAVVDVPLSLLPARVGVQQPTLILMDVDAEGALQAASRIRELPGGPSIDILFLGEPGRTFGDSGEALRHDGSGFFARPVDVDALLHKVAVLVGAASGTSPIPPGQVPAGSASGGPTRGLPQVPSRPPSAVFAPRLSPPPPSSRLSGAPVSPRPPAIAPGPADPWAEEAVLPAGTFDVDAAGASLASAAMPASKLSPEIEKLLFDAEARLGEDFAQARPGSRPPSPEEEVEAVLPAELLAALDDPLDEEDEDNISESGSGGPTPARGTSASRPPSHATGSGKRTPIRTATGADTRPPAPRPGYPPPVVLADEADDPPALEVAIAASRVPDIGSMARPTSRPLALASSKATPVPAPSPISTPRPTARGASPSASSLRRPSESSTRDEPVTPIPERSVPLPGRLPTGMAPPSSPDEAYEVIARATPGGIGPPAAHDSSVASVRGSTAAPPEGLADHSEPISARAPSTTTPKPPFESAVPASPFGVRSLSHSNNGRSQSAPPIPAELGGDGAGAVRALAVCIRERASGALCIDCADGVRRVLLRDGDLVTAASGLDRESLVEFLATRGDMTRHVSGRLRGKIPAFGRHAGAALVANGQLTQDQLWPVLRAHAEWVIGNALRVSPGMASFEREPPARLKAEPSVFGGAAGAEVFIEVLRRVVPAEVALARLGGASAVLRRGSRTDLIGECALGEAEQEAIAAADPMTLAELVARVPEAGFAAAIYALVELGVLEARAAEPSRSRSAASVQAHGLDPLDEEALREQVRARTALVEEADYFALLGVSRHATAYEIRRAYLELRRTFEPSRVLTPRNADLDEELRTIVEVLDEAYEILRDEARRERYRRAIEGAPSA